MQAPTTLTIRSAHPSDVDEMLRVYTAAQDFMIAHNNPNQWARRYPTREILLSDMAQEHSYVVLCGDRICGAFAIQKEPECVYAHIDGTWLNNLPYLTIHRVASDHTARGVFDTIVAFCEKRHHNLRIDTHADNLVMRHLIQKHGFTQCGIVYMPDGTPRFGYQRYVEEPLSA